jgi:hypothetical protein
VDVQLHVDRQNAEFFSTLPKSIFFSTLDLPFVEKMGESSYIFENENESDQHNAAAGNPCGMIYESKHRKVCELFLDLGRES